MYSNQKGPQATSFLRFSLSRHHGRAYPRPYTSKFCPSKNCPVFSCHEVSGVLDKTHNPPSFVLLKFPWFGPNFKGIAVKSVVDLSADSSGDVTPHSWQKITGETPDVCSDKRKPRMLLRLQRRRTKDNRRNIKKIEEKNSINKRLKRNKRKKKQKKCKIYSMIIWNC